jgi:hypothetical protein
MYVGFGCFRRARFQRIEGDLELSICSTENDVVGGNVGIPRHITTVQHLGTISDGNRKNVCVNGRSVMVHGKLPSLREECQWEQKLVSSWCLRMDRFVTWLSSSSLGRVLSDRIHRI